MFFAPTCSVQHVYTCVHPPDLERASACVCLRYVPKLDDLSEASLVLFLHSMHATWLGQPGVLVWVWGLVLPSHVLEAKATSRVKMRIGWIVAEKRGIMPIIWITVSRHCCDITPLKLRLRHEVSSEFAPWPWPIGSI